MYFQKKIKKKISGEIFFSVSKVSGSYWQSLLIHKMTFKCNLIEISSEKMPNFKSVTKANELSKESLWKTSNLNRS